MSSFSPHNKTKSNSPIISRLVAPSTFSIRGNRKCDSSSILNSKSSPKAKLVKSKSAGTVPVSSFRSPTQDTRIKTRQQLAKEKAVVKKEPKYETYNVKLDEYNKQKNMKVVEEPWYMVDPEALIDMELKIEEKFKKKPIPPSNPYGFGSTSSSRIPASKYSTISSNHCKSQSSSRNTTGINSVIDDQNNDVISKLSQTFTSNSAPYFASLLPKNTRAPENISPDELKEMLLADLHARHRNVSDMRTEIQSLENQINHYKLTNAKDKKIISTITKLLRSKQEELVLEKQELDMLCSQGYRSLNKLRSENKARENMHAVVCDRLQRRASMHWQSMHTYGVQSGPEDAASNTARKASIVESRRRKSLITTKDVSAVVTSTAESTASEIVDSDAYVSMMIDEENAIARAMRVLERMENSQETRSVMLRKLKEEFVPAVKEMVQSGSERIDVDNSHSQNNKSSNTATPTRKQSAMGQTLFNMLSNSVLGADLSNSVVNIMNRRSIAMPSAERTLDRTHIDNTTTHSTHSAVSNPDILENGSNSDKMVMMQDREKGANADADVDSGTTNNIPFAYSVLQPPPPSDDSHMPVVVSEEGRIDREYGIYVSASPENQKEIPSRKPPPLLGPKFSASTPSKEPRASSPSISDVLPEYQRRASLSTSNVLPPPPKRRPSILQLAFGIEEIEMAKPISTPPPPTINSVFSPLQPPPPADYVDTQQHISRNRLPTIHVPQPSVYKEYIPSANPPPPVVPMADFTVIDDSGAAVYVDALLPQRRASLSQFSTLPVPSAERRGSVIAQARRMSYVPPPSEPEIHAAAPPPPAVRVTVPPPPPPVNATVPPPPPAVRVTVPPPPPPVNATVPPPPPAVRTTVPPPTPSTAPVPAYSPLQPPPPPLAMDSPLKNAFPVAPLTTSLLPKSTMRKSLPSSKPPPTPASFPRSPSDGDKGLDAIESSAVDISCALPQRRASLADSKTLPAPPSRRPSMIEQARKMSINEGLVQTSKPAQVAPVPVLTPPPPSAIMKSNNQATSENISSAPKKTSLSSLFGSVSPVESLFSEGSTLEDHTYSGSEVSDHEFSDGDY